MSINLKSGQSKKMSLFETIISISLGYILTILIQYYLYPLFGITIPAGRAVIISLVIVVIAFLKNYSVRRVFNYLHLKR